MLTKFADRPLPVFLLPFVSRAVMNFCKSTEESFAKGISPTLGMICNEQIVKYLACVLAFVECFT